MDERIKVLAHNLVNYSMKVQPGNKVYIHYIGTSTQDLARQLVKEVYKAGGVPFPHYTDVRVQREMLLHCTQEQMSLMARIDGAEMEQMDCYVGVRGSDNVSELAALAGFDMGKENRAVPKSVKRLSSAHTNNVAPKRLAMNSHKASSKPSATTSRRSNEEVFPLGEDDLKEF